MKKLKLSENRIPLDQKQFTLGVLKYRKNIIESKKSPFKFWEK